MLTYLADSGRVGATWKETADYLHLHHGQASGTLSVLHKAGRIERLAERRNRCHVYVLPEHVDGRDLSAYQPNRAGSVMYRLGRREGTADLIRELRDWGEQGQPEGWDFQQALRELTAIVDRYDTVGTDENRNDNG